MSDVRDWLIAFARGPHDRVAIQLSRGTVLLDSAHVARLLRALPPRWDADFMADRLRIWWDARGRRGTLTLRKCAGVQTRSAALASAYATLSLRAQNRQAGGRTVPDRLGDAGIDHAGRGPLAKLLGRAWRYVEGWPESTALEAIERHSTSSFRPIDCTDV